MRYARAQDLIPAELLAQLQQYVDGAYLYVPRKQGNHLSWGERTQSKQETARRNAAIFRDAQQGSSVEALAERYFLSEKTIRRILLEERRKTPQASGNEQEQLTMCDKTQIESFLDPQGRLKVFPAKRKKKLSALAYLAGKFEKGKVYTEQEVNELLNRWHLFGDPATLRRELYNNRFLDREANGSRYWLEDPQPVFPEADE